jgi:hypothetical protein
MHSQTSTIWFYLLSASLALAGCNSHRTYRVDGTVKFKDGGDVARLKGYTVSCEAISPGPDGKMPSATGEIDAEGKFQLSTNATNDGAYPGKHRVALTPPIPFGDAPAAPNVIAAKYKDLNTSDLKITVEPKRTAVTLELEPADN